MFVAIDSESRRLQVMERSSARADSRSLAKESLSILLQILTLYKYKQPIYIVKIGVPIAL